MTAPPNAQAQDILLLDEAPVDVTVDASRYHYADDWQTKVAISMGKIVNQPPEGFLPNDDEKKLLAQKGSNGKPLNAVFTVPMLVTAQVFDAKQQLIGTSPAAMAVGYIIAPIPRAGPTVSVNVYGKAPGNLFLAGQISGPVVRGGVSGAVQLGTQSKPTRQGADEGLPTQFASFDNVAPGKYTITVKSLDPHFGSGSTTIEIVDPYSTEAYKAGLQPKSMYTAEVELPFIAKATSQPTSPPSAGQPSGTKTNSGNKTGIDAPSAPGGLRAKTVQDCGQLAAQAQQYAALGDLAGAANVMDQIKLKGCEGLDPNVDVAIAGSKGTLETGEKQRVSQALQDSGQCDFVAAWNLVQELPAGSPGTHGHQSGEIAAASCGAERGAGVLAAGSKCDSSQ